MPRERNPKRSVFARLRSHFLAGVLVTAPIGITIYLTYSFLIFVDTRVSAVLPETYRHVAAIPGLGVLIAAGFFVLVGWFTRNFLGRMIVSVSDAIVDRVPVIGKVYSGIKQVFETLLGNTAQSFREVVIFEYPRTGIWTIGFVAGPAATAVSSLTDESMVNVFLPTSPSPTNGILLFIPKGQLKVVDISIEDAFKMVLSSGIIIPGAAEEKSNG